MRMCRLPVAIASFVLGAASLCASTITYNYSGKNFTSAMSPYTTSDSITGSFTVSSPLPANLSFGDNPGGCGSCAGNISAQVSSYSFFDGVNIWNPTNTATSGPFAPEFYVGTDSQGNFTSWDVVLRGISGPFQFDPDAAELATCAFGSCGEDQAQFLPTASTFASATVNSMPGTWTSTINNLSGGSTSAPVALFSGPPVAGVNGSIGGSGSEEYYLFSWGGGAFSASASITGANTGASYLFSEGAAGTCGGGGSATLNNGDGFTGTIAIANLAAGQYCIGLDADSPNDPIFALTFNTPVNGTGSSQTPEPSGSVLLAVGLAVLSVRRALMKTR